MSLSISVSPVDPQFPADLEEFTQLWLESRCEAGASQEWIDHALGSDRLAEVAQRPDVQVMLARIGVRPVGMLILSTCPVSGLFVGDSVRIEQLWVVPGTRHRGVATALLAAAVTHAERAGVDQVVSNVPAQARDANRFFARFGFGSFMVSRVTSTSALSRRVRTQDPVVSREVMLRRRILRGRSRALAGGLGGAADQTG